MIIPENAIDIKSLEYGTIYYLTYDYYPHGGRAVKLAKKFVKNRKMKIPVEVVSIEDRNLRFDVYGYLFKNLVVDEI